MSYKLRILSLGAGVQSTTLYLMAERGEIEPFHCAIFADTGWESSATYTHLKWLKQVGKTPIVICKNGDVRNMTTVSTNLAMPRTVMPFYLRGNGVYGMCRRKCTAEHKLIPIRREVRKLLGLVPRQRAPKGAVDQIIGISWDERQRMKESPDKYADLSYPLVLKRMSRYDCLEWLKDKGYPAPPKSACVGCPFRSNESWRELPASEFKEAVDFDKIIRKGVGTRGDAFLHKSCKPLEEVDLRTPEERGQMAFDFIKDEKLNLFVNNLSIYSNQEGR